MKNYSDRKTDAAKRQVEVHTGLRTESNKGLGNCRRTHRTTNQSSGDLVPPIPFHPRETPVCRTHSEGDSLPLPHLFMTPLTTSFLCTGDPGMSPDNQGHLCSLEGRHTEDYGRARSDRSRWTDTCYDWRDIDVIR